MKFFRAFIFLFCLPAIFLQPIPSFSMQQETFYNESGNEIFIPRDERGLINPWGYFDAKNIFSHIDGYINHYFDFIELICNEEFLETLSDEELDRILEFTVWVVRYSVSESRPDLKEHYEQEIEELYRLLEEEDDEEEFYFSFNQSQFIPFQLAGCIQNPHFTLCKSRKGWFRKKFHHLKHWSSKNRKPLIIGAVVVGAIAAAALTGGVGGSAVAAVGGGLIDAMDDNRPPDHINKPGEVYVPQEPDYLPPPAQSQYASIPEDPKPLPPAEVSPQGHSLPNDQEIEETYEVIAFEAEVTKEKILEETIDNPVSGEDKGFIDNAASVGKDLGSRLAHSAVETASELSKSMGVVGGVLGHLVDENYQDSIQEHFYYSHEAIDGLFETDLTYLYSEQGKEEIAYLKEKFGIDILSDSDSNLVLAEIVPPGLPVIAGAKAVVPKGGGAVGTAIVGSAIIGSQLPSVVPQSIEQSVAVYRSFNELTNEVSYVGITNNVPRRNMEHLRQRGISIEPVENLPMLNRQDAKFVEQTLIALHGLEKNGGTLINKINSVAETNPSYAEALKCGAEILKEAGYPDLE